MKTKTRKIRDERKFPSFGGGRTTGRDGGSYIAGGVSLDG